MSDLSILIVEDDEVATEILHLFIREYRPDAKIEWCWNGFEALVRIEEVKPDIIFLDYMMPKVDGIEFIKALKNCTTDHNYKIVVISAFVDKEKTTEFLELGADHVLAKPINIEQIEELLKKFSSN